MKVSDYIISCLQEYDVNPVFTLAGGGCIHLMDSLRKSGIGYVSMLHEQGAAIAAEAYAQYNSYLGAAIVTTGPGGTNAISAVASAWLDSVPLMIISGQVQTKDMVGFSGVRQKGFQELNLPEIVKSITKYAVTVTKPSDIMKVMEEALTAATTGRKGPVWIEVPLDIQSSDFEPVAEDRLCEKTYWEEYDFTSIIDAFEASKKPVILLGAGAKECDRTKLFEIISHLQIPILTTWRAADLIEDEMYRYIGRPGMIGQRSANIIQQQADFVLSIGARLDCGQTAFNLKNFAPNAVKFVVDVDENEINKHRIPNKNKILLSASKFVEQFLPFTHEANIKQHLAWKNKIKDIKQKYSLERDSKGIPIYDFLFDLTNNCPAGATIVPGSSGAAAELTLQTWKVKAGQRIINSPGLGSMGFAIPQAIGVYFAKRQGPVICIDGDGSFPMNMQELEVISRFRLPIKIFILNNDGYGSIRNTQDKFFHGQYVGSDFASGLSLPKISAVAKTFEIEYHLFSSKINWNYVFDSEIPMIIEVPLPWKTDIIHRTQAYLNDDGVFMSKPMEDLFPSISDEELEDAMK